MSSLRWNRCFHDDHGAGGAYGPTVPAREAPAQQILIGPFSVLVTTLLQPWRHTIMVTRALTTCRLPAPRNPGLRR